jgi:hypothetical protein
MLYVASDERGTMKLYAAYTADGRFGTTTSKRLAMQAVLQRGGQVRVVPVTDRATYTAQLFWANSYQLFVKG